VPEITQNINIFFLMAEKSLYPLAKKRPTPTFLTPLETPKKYPKNQTSEIP
jgi:hypothetical protein